MNIMDQKPKILPGDIESRRAYSRWHYRKNKEKYKKTSKKHQKQMRQKVREAVSSYLSNHACVDCGESDPVVLDFDHRDPKTKSFNIGSSNSLSKSVKTVKKEMEKCDIRCANCHRRKTYRERGFTHKST